MKTKKEKEILELKEFRKLKRLEIFKFDGYEHLDIFLADSTLSVHLPSLKRNTLHQKIFHEANPDD